MATVHFDTPIAFSNGGGNTLTKADHGGWAAVVMAMKNAPVSGRPFLLAAYVDPSLRCNGGSCPWSAGHPPAMSSDWEEDDGLMRLPPGTYNVVLFGERGSVVTAKLFPDGSTGAPIKVEATKKVPGYWASATPGVGDPGSQYALHAYDQTTAGPGWGIAAMYGVWAVEGPGVFATEYCTTVGSRHQVVTTAGGVVPCAQPTGSNFRFGPQAGPFYYPPVGAYAPVQSGAVAISGPADEPIGMGVDTVIQAPVSHQVALFVAVRLP